MRKQEIREQGYDNGFAIAENVYHDSDLYIGDELPPFTGIGFEEKTVTKENWKDVFLSIALETEMEHFRQFSPFELLAKELNEKRDQVKYDPWEVYEEGVQEGAIAALSRFEPPYRQ